MPPLNVEVSDAGSTYEVDDLHGFPTNGHLKDMFTDEIDHLFPVDEKYFTLYEDVKNIPLEKYFHKSEYSIDVFKRKYFLEELGDKTPADVFWRTTQYIAKAEKGIRNQRYWAKRWFHELWNNYWMAAGSILAGAGNPNKVSLANCFSRGTSFITRQGTKSFQDFSDGEKVEVLTGNCSFYQATVRQYGNQELYKLKLSRNGLKRGELVTGDHKWFRLNKNSRELTTTLQLNKGDELPYIKRKVMQRFVDPIGLQHGFVFGDGTYVRSSDHCEVTLCGEKQDLKDEVFQHYPASADRENTRIKYLPSFMKEFPDRKFNKEYMLGFLVGWFAADGTIGGNGSAEISSAIKSNLAWFVSVAETLGIYCSPIRLLRDINPYNGAPGHECWSVRVVKDCLFEEFFLRDKHLKVWKKIIAQRTRDRSGEKWKVVAVEVTGLREKVWCIEEPVTNSFVLSGGLLTHNCTTLRFGANDSHGDNLKDIHETAYAVSNTAARRQGLGVLFNLRPKAMAVHNSAKFSEGNTHWMKYIQNLGEFVGQRGRIPAMLFAIKDHNPDLLDFITVKSDQNTITNANISVHWSDSFMQTLKDGGTWKMRYETEKGDVLETELPASKLFNKFVDNNWQWAEPGAQFIDRAIEYSNSDYLGDPDYKIVGSNACTSGDTFILTDRGPYFIRDLVGKEVRVWNGEEFTLVTPRVTGRNKELFRVKLSDGRSLDCTANHEWLTRAGRVRTDHLTDHLLENYPVPGLKEKDSFIDVRVASVTPVGVVEKVYCFTEPKTNRGTFNGIVTGQCSEQFLESAGWEKTAGLCVLSSFNMAALPENLHQAAFALRYHIAPSMNRFLDNVVEMEIRDERYALPGQLNSLRALRRVGAGVTNLDGYLIRKGIGYSTQEGVNVITYLLDQFNAGLYETSISLGDEKGSFGIFNQTKFEKSPFVQQMMKRHQLVFKTMRNVCVSSIAPTGTLSLTFREPAVSTGIEPVLGFYYWKRHRTSGVYEWVFVVPKFVRDFLKNKNVDLADHGLPGETVRDPDGSIGIRIAKLIDTHFPKDQFKPAHEIDPFLKADLMANLTKYCVDSSISVTYNLPENVNKATIKKLYLYGWEKGLKSMAVYRDKSRTGIVEFVPPLEAEARYADKNNDTHRDQTDLLSVTEIRTNHAPQRPIQLPANVHHVKVKGEDWIAVVGTYYGRPFEVFAGKAESINLSRKTSRGTIEKKGKKDYYFYPEGSKDRINVTEDFKESIQSCLTRQVSLSLRHGTPLIFIIDQLEKCYGQVLDFSKVLCRVLKKYGTTDDARGNITCSNCGSKNMDFKEGCLTCLDCMSSKC